MNYQNQPPIAGVEFPIDKSLKPNGQQYEAYRGLEPGCEQEYEAEEPDDA